MRSLLAPLALLLLLAEPARPTAAQSSPDDCPMAQWAWSEPDTVSWARSPRFGLRLLNVTARGDTQYVGGNLRPPDRETPLPARTVRLLRIPGGALEPPSGDFAFRAPRLISAAPGRLHLLWSEPDSVTDPRFPWTSLRETWHAIHDGRRWSPPERLPIAHPLGIEDGFLADVDGRGRLHLLVPSATLDGRSRVVHLRRDAGGWKVSPIFDAAVYGALRFGGGDTVIVAFIAPAFIPDGSDENSVWVRLSPDGGETWEETVHVQLSGALPAYRVDVAHAEDGTLHLVWGQNLRGGLTTGALRHRWSVDGGRTWKESPDSFTQGDAQMLSAAALEDGAFVVLLETGRAPTETHLELHRWKQGRLDVHPAFRPPPSVHDAQLTRSGSVLHLTWGTVDGRLWHRTAIPTCRSPRASR